MKSSFLAFFLLVSAAGVRAAIPAAPAGGKPAATAPAAPNVMPKVEVTGRQEAFYNSIDRKVYVVGKDVVSATGSAGDLLQNVPSVQVDVDGAVSLRGESGVSILINGKSSSAMQRDPAAALEALPADAIERIEIITNPSAKYRPDGTAGIINLVLKRPRSEGYSGTVRASVGNEERYNASVGGNYRPGKLNLHGRISLRQDDRSREAREERSHANDGGRLFTLQETEERSRPRSVFGEAGLDYKLGAETEAGAVLGFGGRDDDRNSRQANRAWTAEDVVTTDHERLRAQTEREREWDLELKFTHGFDGKGRELAIEVQTDVESDRDDRRYRTLHRIGGRPPEMERTREETKQYDTEVTIDYTHPLDGGAKIEAGYAGEWENGDRDFVTRIIDAGLAGEARDDARSDRFRHDSLVHAFYATFGRPFGRLGFLAGLRYELSRIETERPDAGARGESNYRELYPTLHLSYDFSDVHRVQLNYSHRIERPDGEDLNPYIDYEDPTHLRTGNPGLRPEDAHSIEAGYEYRAQETTYLASIYHRYRTNGITGVTRLLDATTLLTRPENVGTSRSSGLELGATRRWRGRIGTNFSANVYRHEIDARNLGFTGQRQATAWEAKLNVQWEAGERLLLQFNTSYRAKRLTPQGERRPSAVTNLGVRYDLKDGKTSLIATVSDVFDSLRDRTVIDTPALQTDITRRRSSRIVYIGFTRQFGKPAKKSREEMEFDDTL